MQHRSKGREDNDAPRKKSEENSVKKVTKRKALKKTTVNAKVVEQVESDKVTTGSESANSKGTE
jgi:hypothetical protein